MSSWVTGTSLTPGPRRMIDRAGAAVPFTPAARLLADLAGLDVNAEAVQRTAEADGRAAAVAITARAEAIRTRTPVPLPPPHGRTSSTSRSTAPASR